MAEFRGDTRASVLFSRNKVRERVNLGVVLRGKIAGVRDGDWATNEPSH